MEVSGAELTRFFAVVMPHMNEVQRRVVAGAMAEAIGHGGKSQVAAASGMSRNTVVKAAGEVSVGIEPSDRLRAAGAGDKPAVDKQPGLLTALDELVNPDTRGTPMSALKWTLKSTYQLAEDLKRRGFKVSAELVRRLLHQLGYSLQAPSKQIEGSSHPDRDGQFNYLNDTVTAAVAAGEPVISVDTKKKELIGNYANGGREWETAGQPTEVNVHDFPDRRLGDHTKAIPYGIYDLANDEGWVSVGDTADTAEFAVEAIRRWWNTHGHTRFPNATSLTITADCGGSNGYRVRAWKAHLAKLAAETGLTITVLHYPPGTSKWNKIEHRLFSFISINWRGRSLTDIRTIIELISATSTRTGLTVQASYDPNWYPTGEKITDADMKALPLTSHAWHPDWNYTLTPPATASCGHSSNSEFSSCTTHDHPARNEVIVLCDESAGNLPPISIRLSDSDEPLDIGSALDLIQGSSLPVAAGWVNVRLTPLNQDNKILLVDWDIYKDASTLREGGISPLNSWECQDACLDSVINDGYLDLKIGPVAKGQIIIISSLVTSYQGVVGQSWGATVS